MSNIYDLCSYTRLFSKTNIYCVRTESLQLNLVCWAVITAIIAHNSESTLPSTSLFFERPNLFQHIFHLNKYPLQFAPNLQTFISEKNIFQFRNVALYTEVFKSFID